MFKKPLKNHQSTASQSNHLDEIRQVEARVASRILLARQEAEEIQQSSREQARQIIAQTRQTGAETGKARYEVSIREAEQEAERLTVEVQAQSEVIESSGRQRVVEAARWALNVALGFVREDSAS